MQLLLHHKLQTKQQKGISMISKATKKLTNYDPFCLLSCATTRNCHAFNNSNLLVLSPVKQATERGLSQLLGKGGRLARSARNEPSL